jgi:hypothetical protein
MAEQRKLSEERLELIRRFMGEPPSEPELGTSADEPPPPVAPEEAPPASVANGKPPVAPEPVVVPRARTRAPRIPATVQARVLWHRFDLRWPLAITIIGVLVGLLFAR